MVQLRSITVQKGLVGGPFGSSLVSRDYVDAGVPVIRGINMSEGRFVGGDFAHVSQEKFETDLSRNSAHGGDLIYTQRGTLGQVALLRRDEAIHVISQSQMRLRIDNTLADPYYVYYASKSPHFLWQIDNHAISTGVPHINLGILGELEIPLPPIEEQRAIAATLGALDDKIESNWRIVAIANELVNAELMSIFGGRELELPLGEITNVTDCLHSKKPARADSGPTLMQLDNIRDDGLVDTTKKYPIKSDDYTKWSAKFSTQPWDHVLTNVGRIGAVARIPEGFTAALGRNMTGVRPNNPDESGSFLTAALQSAPVRREIELRTDAGTIMNALNVRSIPQLRLPASTVSERRAFHSAWSPMYRHLDVLLEENRQLDVLRNTLLPELLNGRVRVPGEKFTP